MARQNRALKKQKCLKAGVQVAWDLQKIRQKITAERAGEKNANCLEPECDPGSFEDGTIVAPIHVVLIVDKNSRDRLPDAKIQKSEISSDLSDDRPKAKFLPSEIVESQGDRQGAIDGIGRHGQIART